MRVVVEEELCDLHGQCVFAAPEIFRMTDAGELEYEPEIGEELTESARAAEGLCPAGAIRLIP